MCSLLWLFDCWLTCVYCVLCAACAARVVLDIDYIEAPAPAGGAGSVAHLVSTHLTPVPAFGRRGFGVAWEAECACEQWTFAGVASQVMARGFDTVRVWPLVVSLLLAAASAIVPLLHRMTAPFAAADQTLDALSRYVAVWPASQPALDRPNKTPTLSTLPASHQSVPSSSCTSSLSPLCWPHGCIVPSRCCAMCMIRLQPWAPCHR